MPTDNFLSVEERLDNMEEILARLTAASPASASPSTKKAYKPVEPEVGQVKMWTVTVGKNGHNHRYRECAVDAHRAIDIALQKNTGKISPVYASEVHFGTYRRGNIVVTARSDE